MKRSEMVKVLQESFIKNMNSTEVDSDETMYSNILQDLEDSDMLPPFVDIDTVDDPDQEWFTLHVNGAGYAGLCEWEPE